MNLFLKFYVRKMKKKFKYIGREKEYRKEYYQRNRNKLNRKERERYRKLNPIEIGQGNGKGSKKTQFKKGFTWEEKFGSEKAKKMKIDKRILTKKLYTGKIVSKKTKKKMSDSWNYDKHFTEKTRKKMSELTKGENNPNYGNGEKIIGEKNPAWLGGISFEPYDKNFNNILKKKIRQRDNFTCQECGKSEVSLKRKLSIHHIDYNKKNNKSLNLISLCLRCHIKTNLNREHWKQHFKMKVFIREFLNPENIVAFKDKKLIAMHISSA